MKTPSSHQQLWLVGTTLFISFAGIIYVRRRREAETTSNQLRNACQNNEPIEKDDHADHDEKVLVERILPLEDNHKKCVLKSSYELEFDNGKSSEREYPVVAEDRKKWPTSSSLREELTEYEDSDEDDQSLIPMSCVDVDPSEAETINTSLTTKEEQKDGSSKVSSSSSEIAILGVSVHHLQRVFLEEKVCCHHHHHHHHQARDDSSRSDKGEETVQQQHQKLSQFSTIYEINSHLQNNTLEEVIRRNSCDDVSCPVDEKRAAAYVHSLDGADHVGEATHYLSYSWEYTIGDVVDTLTALCERHDLDPKRTYIWIDCLCLNQHRLTVRESSHRHGAKDLLATISFEDFHRIFFHRITGIGNLLAMVAPWSAPINLTRVWCIYEVYAAHTLGCKVEFVMPPNERNSLKRFIREGRGMERLFEVFANVDVQNGKASLEDDREKILKWIESTVGYNALNDEVNDLLHGWIQDLLEERKIATKKMITDDQSNSTPQTIVRPHLQKNGEYDLSTKSPKSVLEKHPSDTAVTHNKIGTAMKRKGDYDRWLAHYQRCLAIQESMLGQEHPMTATTYNNMGSVLEAKGDNDVALEHYNKCLTIRKLVLGKDHPDTASAHHSIGSVLKTVGNYDGALKHYLKCFIGREAVLGKDHPATANVLYDIGSTLMSKGDYRDALKYFKQSAASHQNIGSEMRMKGDYQRSLLHFEKSLAIHEAVLGKDHPEVATTHNCIGLVLKDKGDHDGAVKQLQQALTIAQSTLAKGHPSTAMIVSNIGAVLEDKGDNDGALECYQQCLTILVTSLGEDHLHTARAYYNLGTVLQVKGDYNLALEKYQRCLAIRESKLGRAHKDTRHCLDSIISLRDAQAHL